MFNSGFYPTPQHLIEIMTMGIDFNGKYVCEPSAGKGDIVDYVKVLGAEGVCAYEIEDDLRKILAPKCSLLGKDWLEASSVDISHVNYIIMNPPFDTADKHILHAWEIAPEGCEIIAICNAETVRSNYTNSRRRLTNLISKEGSTIQYIEDAFKTSSGSERGTNVEIALFKLYKPGASENFDYEGFYFEEEPDYTEQGIIAYSEIRDIVGRYIESLRAFDKMSVEMDTLRKYATSVGLNGSYSLQLNTGAYGITTKEDFLKELQKAAWEWIFRKLDIDRMVTTEVKEKLNKFVSTQHKVPFTVKNVKQMIAMIVGTFKENMDKAMVNVFDYLTERYDENRYNVEGWKTNKAHCIGKKFILPSSVKVGYQGQIASSSYDEKYDRITDLQKAMAYLIGERYSHKSLYQFFLSEEKTVNYKATEEDFQRELQKSRDYLRHSYTEMDEDTLIKRVREKLDKKEKEGETIKVYKEFGKWYDFGYFTIKGFKKGTLHCKFNNEKHWEMLNRRVNEIKGFPLPEKI